MTAASKALAKRPSKAELARQEKFCIEYVFNGNNGTQAYLAAYPKAKLESCRTLAWRLLTNVHIRQRIDELRDEHHDDLLASHKRILQEVADQALFDPVNMFDPESGRLLHLHEMDPVTRKMVNEIEISITDDGDAPLRMAKIKYGKEKRAYLDMMMKHYNQYQAHQVAGSTQPMTVMLHEADSKL